jgi:hypothetical protein
MVAVDLCECLAFVIRNALFAKHSNSIDCREKKTRHSEVNRRNEYDGNSLLLERAKT